jgi:ABC-type branched-subunit amino acid transport system substrate-binding protein
MAEISLQSAYKVTIIESERGWGSKIDEVKYFDNEQEARNFVAEYNKYNDKPEVPDWYMYASYEGRVR